MLAKSILLLLFPGYLIFISAPLTAFLSDNGPEVLEFVICKDVLEREPVDIVNTFTVSDDRGWVFARINNPEEMTYVHFVWYFEEEVYFEIRMRVGVSPAWRTYSSVALQEGAWRVELLDNDREVLKEIRFHVSE